MQCKSTLPDHFSIWRFQTTLFFSQNALSSAAYMKWICWLVVVIFLLYFTLIPLFRLIGQPTHNSNNKNTTNIQILKYRRVIDWFSDWKLNVKQKHWKFHEIHLMRFGAQSNHSKGHINVNHFHCVEYENDSILSLFIFIRYGECKRQIRKRKRKKKRKADRDGERERERQFEILFIRYAQC